VSLAFVAIGDELLTGRVLDRHLLQVGRDLAMHGLSLRSARVVPDDVSAIQSALDAESAAGARSVVLTGGLGPTPDDMTREGVAAWAGAPLELHAVAHEQVLRQVALRHREPVDADVRLATLPKGAAVLPNSVGTAPGFHLVGPTGLEIWALPGVPAEFRRMWLGEVLPRLRVGSEQHVALQVLRTSGAGEREVADRIASLFARPDCRLGTYAGEGEVEVHVAVEAAGPLVAEERLTARVAEVRLRLGDLVHGEGDEALAEAVARRLGQRGETLATAESVTGGLLASLLTDVPGSSAWFLGGAVAYSVGHKTRQLGLDPELVARAGHVSPEVSRAMARQARALHGATWGLATTGWAGPDGGRPGEEAGLVHLALEGPDGLCGSWTHRFPGVDRPSVKLRAARAALRALWLAMGLQS